MSGTEKRFRRQLITRVARYEMLDARANGILPGRIPFRLGVKELKRALKERRKVRRMIEAVGQ